MARAKKSKREWYSASYTTVMLVALVVLMAGGAFGYQRLDHDSEKNQADRAIEEAAERVEVGRKTPGIADSQEFSKAEKLLDEAVEAFEQGNFQRALVRGEGCLVILAGLENRNEGFIRVLSAQGSVHYRRSQRGSWKRLRAHDRLSAGDWVKTASNGAAELFWKDGSVFTLRQSTLIQIRDRNGATNLHSGRLKVRTSTRDSTVTTRGSLLRVSRDSKALVSFDRHSRTGRFVVFAGRLDVTAEDSGETRVITADQQMDLTGGVFSPIRAVPGTPVIAGPANDHAIELGKKDEVKLDWEPVENARRYALKVSANRLFSDTFIDHRRTKTSARVGVRREGQFYWQVAALDARGNPGHWSEVRSFRAIAARPTLPFNDQKPPLLKIVSQNTLGSWVILVGKTESGATVTVNDEPVTVKGNGTFQAIHQVSKAGRSKLRVVATDVWGNRTSDQVEVFVYGV